MSGIAPYIYLELGDGLTALGDTTLQYLYDSTDFIVVVVAGDDQFQGGCLTWVENRASHPLGVYNINYPYCRTALQYNMADARADPQIGQLIVVLPYLSVKVKLVGCDISRPTSVVGQLEPPVTDRCAAELYPSNDPTEFYLIISKAGMSLPARFTFTVTNANAVRTFWVGFRDSRGGLPSGAVL